MSGARRGTAGAQAAKDNDSEVVFSLSGDADDLTAALSGYQKLESNLICMVVYVFIHIVCLEYI